MFFTKKDNWIIIRLVLSDFKQWLFYVNCEDIDICGSIWKNQPIINCSNSFFD